MGKLIKTKTVELVGYRITGEVRVNMWGGGRGRIDMEQMFLEVKHFSKDNIMRCVNDHGFGVESIYEAWICIDEIYESGAIGKSIELLEVKDEYNTSLFNGWKHLRSIGVMK